MKKNILLILLVLFMTTLLSGCFGYRRDRNHQRHDTDDPTLQIDVR
ncbi:MAG: hypothetical protein PHQ96_03335 [Candidatus Omnitrophica bacterium]|nr:hypothetical protein [Candidatus Omnitrophota bacterium]